jgi:hypothetical protein
MAPLSGTPSIKDDPHDFPPMLDEHGTCRFCGLTPFIVKRDEKALQDYPNGHDSKCRAIARGWTEETTYEEIMGPKREKQAAADALNPPVDNDAAEVARKA